HVVRSVVADLEVDLLLARIGDEVEVLVEHSVAEAMRARRILAGAIGRRHLLDVQEAAHQLVARVDLEHAVGAGPVLDAARELVLGFLRAGGCEQGEAEQGLAHGGTRLRRGDTIAIGYNLRKPPGARATRPNYFWRSE